MPPINLPLIKEVIISAIDAKTESGKPCKAFVIRMYSEDIASEAYLVSQVFLSENGISELKKTLQKIAKDLPEVFSGEKAQDSGTIEG